MRKTALKGYSIEKMYVAEYIIEHIGEYFSKHNVKVMELKEMVEELI